MIDKIEDRILLTEVSNRLLYLKDDTYRKELIKLNEQYKHDRVVQLFPKINKDGTSIN